MYDRGEQKYRKPNIRTDQNRNFEIRFGFENTKISVIRFGRKKNRKNQITDVYFKYNIIYILLI